MPYADSFSSTGVTSNTSRITEAMYGMIMIARITPAHRMPMPIGGPWNSAPTTGMSPSTTPSGFSNYVAKIGANTSRPHMPYTIDGIAASSSIAMPSGRRSHAGDEFGQEERDAEADRHRDDERNDRGRDRAVDRHERAEMLAGRIPVGGPQKARPNSSIDGMDATISETMMPPSSSNVTIAASAREAAEDDVAETAGRRLLRRAAGRVDLPRQTLIGYRT